MFDKYHCDGVEQALDQFPELRKFYQTEVQTLNGDLVLFTNAEVPPEDLKIFKNYTKEQVIKCLS